MVGLVSNTATRFTKVSLLFTSFAIIVLQIVVAYSLCLSLSKGHGGLYQLYVGALHAGCLPEPGDADAELIARMIKTTTPGVGNVGVAQPNITEACDELYSALEDICPSWPARYLGNVDGAVLRLKAPLLKLQESLGEAQGRYKEELGTLEAALRQQSRVRARRPGAVALSCNVAVAL